VNKVSLIATTVLTGTLLFTSTNVTEAKADEVTANNAKDIAMQAMKDSGGNPNLQNFKAVKDKGDYYEIGVNNKSDADIGTYKVFKDGEVQYKSGHFGNYSSLSTGNCYTGQGITTKSYHAPQHAFHKEPAVDSTRELNSFYVGDVQSTDLPEETQNTLPDTGKQSNQLFNNVIAGSSLLVGGLLIVRRRHSSKIS